MVSVTIFQFPTSRLLLTRALLVSTFEVFTGLTLLLLQETIAIIITAIKDMV
ncbi:MAG: hypothetical protein JWP78_144 [Mucilaginibacter sp.]|nr:hypothetical protein [Mucilaginibacter sp.]